MTYSGHPDQNCGPTIYSQNGEDVLVLNLFKQIGIALPSYLDVGAHHPISISNTALLYEMGCRGVNIDANSNRLSDFVMHRPEDVSACVGVSSSEEELTYYIFDDHSGRNTFSFAEGSRWEREEGRVIAKTKRIRCKTLNQVVNDFCDGKFPDFLNLDVEGLDFAILEATNFISTAPKVICVEVREYSSTSMTAMLDKKGFRPYARMGENIVYVHDNCMPRLVNLLGLTRF